MSTLSDYTINQVSIRYNIKVNKEKQSSRCLNDDCSDKTLYRVAARCELVQNLLINSTDVISRASVFYFELIPLFVFMRLQRRSISWSLFVVSLAAVRFACWDSNSFWSWLNSHILKNYKLIKLSPFYNGVEAPLSYIERLVETLHPNLVFCKQMHKAPI